MPAAAAARPTAAGAGDLDPAGSPLRQAQRSGAHRRYVLVDGRLLAGSLPDFGGIRRNPPPAARGVSADEQLYPGICQDSRQELRRCCRGGPNARTIPVADPRIPLSDSPRMPRSTWLGRCWFAGSFSWQERTISTRWRGDFGRPAAAAWRTARAHPRRERSKLSASPGGVYGSCVR